jgi:hypothetical protein
MNFYYNDIFSHEFQKKKKRTKNNVKFQNYGNLCKLRACSFGWEN